MSREYYAKDLSGQTFNFWTVKERDWSVDTKKSPHWICECKCGIIKTISGGSLKNGASRSCRKCYCRSQKRIVNKTYWHNTKGSAKKRNLEFDITLEYITDLLINQDFKCALSGVEIKLANTTVEQKQGKGTASLDRKDSSKGYIKGNVQWVHKKVNIIKWDMTQDEFVGWCEKIVNYQRKTYQ